jgi:hypothetical protein
MRYQNQCLPKKMCVRSFSYELITAPSSRSQGRSRSCSQTGFTSRKFPCRILLSLLQFFGTRCRMMPRALQADGAVQHSATGQTRRIASRQDQ